jgi:hypothetical protein
MSLTVADRGNGRADLLPRVGADGFFGIRFESIGGLGAHLAGQLLAEAGVVRQGLSGAHFSSYGSANLRTFDLGYRELRRMTWPQEPGDPSRPVQRPAPAFGYLDAPIGGTILDPGSSIAKNMSTSRQGSPRPRPRILRALRDLRHRLPRPLLRLVAGR